MKLFFSQSMNTTASRYAEVSFTTKLKSGGLPSSKSSFCLIPFKNSAGSQEFSLDIAAVNHADIFTFLS
jgi:hypothetical protein